VNAKALIPIIVLGLAGCSPGQSSAPFREAGGQACPATDFPGFAEAFMAKEAVQRQFIRMPLEWLTLMDGPEEGEPIVQAHDLTAKDLPRPLIPNRADQARQGLVLQVKGAELANPWLELSKPGGADLTHYQFEKTADCWRLIVIRR
jgi:hypothetical protein